MRALAIIVALASGCHRVEARPDHAAATPRPAACVDVAPGSLGAALDGAEDGDALCLEAGDHAGPVRIDRRVTLWGPRDAVVRARGGGSVIVVAAAGATLEGFTIDGTGGRFDVEDAAVHVIADDATVEGVEVVHAVYGILVEEAKRARIVGNHIRGDARRAIGLRGDTIRLWEAYDSVVERNVVEDGRDVVVWYSGRNRIIDNEVSGGRYGTHLMYGDDNVVEGNRYVGTTVGVFVMYSRGVVLRRNLVARAGGASGMAIGLKDSGNIRVEANVLIGDTVGLFVDETPGRIGDTLAIADNLVRQCDTAVAFHTTPRSTELTGNDLADNVLDVRADAGTDPTQARWRGNYFGDYAGYDLDDDGTGDVPYQARSAAEDLVARYPGLAFFHGGAALGVVEAGAELLPLWEPRVLLEDPAPRMTARSPEEVLDAR